MNCALDTAKLYPSDGCFLFSLIELKMHKFIIAIINSKLLTYFYQLLSFEKGRVLAQVKPTILSLLPLYNSLPNIYLETITDLYDQYQVTQNDETLNHIDIFTYKLYNLTYEEVLLVDPEFDNIMNQEEYDNYEVE